MTSGAFDHGVVTGVLALAQNPFPVRGSRHIRDLHQSNANQEFSQRAHRNVVDHGRRPGSAAAAESRLSE